MNAFGIKKKKTGLTKDMTAKRLLDTQKQEEGIGENGEVPSLWDYNPCCLPKEFVDLDSDTFLVDSSRMNICFLSTTVLKKICAMVS